MGQKSDPLFSSVIFKIQSKIPIVKNIDALTLLYWFLLIEACVFSIFMWVTQGADSTVHWWFYQNGWATQEMAMYQGIGIHWSTLFYISFFTFNLSVYLRQKLKVVGFHNIGYSLVMGYWVSAMVFELIYVPLMDFFRNFAEVTRFPILLSGWNTIFLGATGQAGAEAPRWIAVTCILYPITFAIIALLLFRRYGNSVLIRYGYNTTEKIMYGIFGSVYAVSFVFALWFTMNVGIFPVLIRNVGWFSGALMAHVLLIDALQNPVARKPVEFEYRWKDKKVWIVFAIFLVGYFLWVIYPVTPLNQIFPAQVVKGFWFPQTVYAFYESELPIIIDQIWVENTGIWFLNHVITKPLAGLFTVMLFAPKIKEKIK